MSIQYCDLPPSNGKAYVIPQLEGEMLSIPGSKGVFRILTSAIQTDDAMSVFTTGAVLADAPGFHHHNEAHDVFLVTKGYMKLWNGDRCRILGPGDFASIPPGVIHNPHGLGPHTESLGLITPGNWIDFFRYVSESYDGIIVPQDDNRNLVEILIPKIMAAKGKYDVHFHPHHVGCEVGEWDARDTEIPEGTEPYYLRANTGPRWMLGGVMSRPFSLVRNADGKFAISSIESSARYGGSVFDEPRAFNVHHCFIMFEGLLEVKVEGAEQPVTIHEGETLFLPARTKFELRFKSKFVRFWSFASGEGIETLIQEAGSQIKAMVLPDQVEKVDGRKVEELMQRLGSSSSSNGVA